MITTKSKVEYITKKLEEIKVSGEQRKDQRKNLLKLVLLLLLSLLLFGVVLAKIL